MKTFEFKLYHHKRNKYLHRRIDVSSEIYNHCIALHRRYYRLCGKYLNKYQLQKHITKLKRRQCYEHWNLVGSQAIQDITDRIERGYQLFFDSLKKRLSKLTSGNGKHKRVGPPGFKKRKKYRSFTLKQAGYALLGDNNVRIHDRVYRYHKSLEIEGCIKTLTVKRDTLGDIYFCFSCEVEKDQTNRVMTGKSAGFDFGLKTYLTGDDGTDDVIEEISPLFFKQGIKEIKKANRELSRKQKGSNNWTRAKLNLARLHKRIANQRQDYHYSTGRKLVKKYDAVFFENLHLKSMQMMWGKKISDLGFGDFLKILECIAAKNGVIFGKIDRFYPSSKECSECHEINHDLRLKDREWNCPVCKAHHDREKNAAKNIHRVGASTYGVGSVRPPCAATPV